MTTSGMAFGRYTIVGALGEGGFATVYRAWDPALNREVALKALLPHLAQNREIYRRFIAEAQALARLHHPNIVQVHDVGDEGGRPYFAMELVPGQTLAAAIRTGVPEPGQAIEVVRLIASALDSLHQAGLVHRDIKPANVMLEPGGRIVLMDLGIARSMDSTQVTQTGTSLGTPTYMAPEQVRGQPAGPAADIYSLGILTYHLLAGQPPFAGDTAFVLHAQAFDPPPPLAELRPGLSPAIYAAIDSALAKEPSQRPSTAGAFAAALAGQGAADSATRTFTGPVATERIVSPGFEPTIVTPIPYKQVTPSRRPLLAIALALVVLAGAGLGVVAVLAFRNKGDGKSANSAVATQPSSKVASGDASTTSTGTSSATRSPMTPASSRTTTATPTPQPTPTATAALAVTLVGVTVRNSGTWAAGQAPLQGCFDFRDAVAATGIRLRVTRDLDPASPLADGPLTPLSASSGNVCTDVPAAGRVPGGNYLALFYDQDWAERARVAFNLAPQPPVTVSATVTRTVTASATATRTATSVGLPLSPDLSSPVSTNASRPAPKIIAVTPLNAPRAGLAFEFDVVAKNFGVTGGAGTISISSPDQPTLLATVGSCDMFAQPHTYPPGTRVSLFSNGAVSGSAASRDPLAELEFVSGWPANDQCVMDVRVSGLTGSSATFYLRATVNAAAGGTGFNTWPIQSSIVDQQGLPVVRWTVPINP